MRLTAILGGILSAAVTGAVFAQEAAPLPSATSTHSAGNANTLEAGLARMSTLISMDFGSPARSRIHHGHRR